MITHEIRPNIQEITIEAHEVEVIKEATFDLRAQLSDISEQSLLDELAYRSQETREDLPQLTEALGKIATHKSAKVTVVSFPESTIEDIPPTPAQHLEPSELNLFTPDLYRGMIISMADWYGYGYTTQQNQVIHNNIIPVQKLESVAGHSGSAPNELGLHVEDASYNLGDEKDISPDFLTLHYFRNPSNVPTLVSMPDWRKISSQTIDLLSEPWFCNRTNPAQGGEDNNPQSPVSVLYGPDQSDPWIRLNTAKLDIDLYDRWNRQALTEFKNHLEERRMDLSMRMGQIAIIDNRRVLHGRPAYQPHQAPKYDGTDRWQRRLTVANDRHRIQKHETRYRVVDPESVLR